MEIIIIIILIILLVYKTKEDQKSSQKNQTALDEKFLEAKDTPCSISCSEKEENINDLNELDYRKSYQARYLLTKNEWHEFKALQKVADEKDYMICPKVRLLDIIEPIKGQKKYRTLFYKIQAKHVDFVICDRDVHIKAIIELDDSSHNREDRIERDHFVDEILRSVGYKVIHAKAITPEILDLV